MATQGCVLTKAENSAPFVYRALGDGSDFVATVQVRRRGVNWDLKLASLAC